MSLTFAARAGDPSRIATPLLVVALPPSETLPKSLAALDKRYAGALSRAVRRKDFKGAKDESLLLLGRDGGPERVLLVGTGSAERVAGITRAATLGGRKANGLGVGALTFWAADLADAALEGAVIGISLGSWEFREYHSAPKKGDRKVPVARATVLVANVAKSRTALEHGIAVAEGQRLTRRLAMLPGNVCTPQYLADTAKDIAKRHKLGVTVLGRKEMQKLGMNSFLAVAAATTQDPKLIVLEYHGGAKGEAPVALVGKGLCFDSGGISIKPAASMEMMKFDMSGAAGVLGAIEAIARMRLRVNVVGLIGSTTNMLGGEAMKPGDVVIASNGKSIEIQNTDAEGRLVLADVLTYAKRFEPQAVIDAATLTGAVVVALGSTTTGVMGHDQMLVDEVLAAARKGGEVGWQLPLFEEYKELIKSDVADMRNIGGRGAGTITAALFLAEFAEGMPWVHLDIAGTAYSETDLVVMPKGPTGTPVRTFVEFVRGRAR
jgi:leucyl aminopeptidase